MVVLATEFLYKNGNKSFWCIFRFLPESLAALAWVVDVFTVPDESLLPFFLWTGKGKTTVGSTHSDTELRLTTSGALTQTFLPPPVAVEIAFPSFSVTTRSSFSLAEKPLHIQSWIMMLLGLVSKAEPNRSPSSDAPQISSSGKSSSSEAQSSGSPKLKPRGSASGEAVAGSPGSAARLGERGGVGNNSNFFQMSSPGGAESGPQK